MIFFTFSFLEIFPLPPPLFSPPKVPLVQEDDNQDREPNLSTIKYITQKWTKYTRWDLTCAAQCGRIAPCDLHTFTCTVKICILIFISHNFK